MSPAESCASLRIYAVWRGDGSYFYYASFFSSSNSVLQYLQDIVYHFLFEVCTAHEFLTAERQYATSGIAADFLQFVYHPLFDLICKLIEIDIKVCFTLFTTLTIHIYLKTYQTLMPV